VAPRPSRHAAEVPTRRRLGIVVSAGVAAVAAAAALVVLVVSSIGGSSTAADPLAPTMSAPNAPSSSPTLPPQPAPYVASSAPSHPSRSRARTAAPIPVVKAGPPIHRMTLQEKAARIAAETGPFSLRIGTLNVLGSQHTTGKNSKFGPGTSRAAREVGLIGSRGLDLVGLQEVQRDQLSVFVDQLSGYAVFPQVSQSSQGYRLQIAYRTDRFTPMASGQVSYLFSHMWIPLPWLLLRDNATGGEFYVVNAHNSPEGEQTERVTSSTIEITLINQLKATGHPVLFLGDLNETGAVYCRVAAGTGVTGSDGASYDGSCHLPGGYTPIDWIMGTAGVTWSDYHIDGTTRAQGMSDHNLVYATASVQDYPDGVPPATSATLPGAASGTASGAPSGVPASP
jgi:hypothetical protein